MTANWERICIAIGDACFGWALRQHQDVALIMLVVGSAGAIGLARRWLVNADRLRDVTVDSFRLRQLIREARNQGDAVAVQRHRLNRRRVAAKKLQSEFGALLFSVAWLSILMNWGSARLQYRTVAPDSHVVARMRLPVSARGELVVLEPIPRVHCESGWVRVADILPAEKGSLPVVEWTLQLKRPHEGPVVLRWSFGTEEFEHLLDPSPFSIQALHKEHTPLISTELTPPIYRPFPSFPGIDCLQMPPWLIAYCIGTLAFLLVPRLGPIMRSHLRDSRRMAGMRGGGAGRSCTVTQNPLIAPPSGDRTVLLNRT